MSRALPKGDQFKAAAAGDPEWLTLSLKHAHIMVRISASIIAFSLSSTTSAVTPLHSAAAKGMLACTEMLVRARADVHACDKNGHTPLDMARSYCHRLVAR
ncbi:unnamed protein product [Boreogadus saida]